MNKKTLIIWIGIVVLLFIAIVKLYYVETARMEMLKEKYPTETTRTTKPSISTTETTEVVEKMEPLDNPTDNSTVGLPQGLKGQIYKFKSTLNDIEEGGQIIHTNYETTYHTFDFENLTIIQEGGNSSGDWKTFTYPMKSFYEDGLTTVIVVNHNGVKEAWFVIATNALGYDLVNGQRLAFYDLIRIK